LMIIYIYDFFTTRWNQQDFPFCFHSSTSCIYTHRDTQPTSAHHDRI
jgi:hypothetical protein